MDKFKDKVVIITGASEGIGRALSLNLSSRKPKLVLAARNNERLMQLKEEAEAKGSTCIVVSTDVSKKSECKNLIDQTISEFGCLDVLVNNAGRTMWTTLQEMEDPSIIEKLIRTN